MLCMNGELLVGCLDADLLGFELPNVEAEFEFVGSVLVCDVGILDVPFLVVMEVQGAVVLQGDGCRGFVVNRGQVTKSSKHVIHVFFHLLHLAFH